MIDDGPAIHYAAVPRGTPVYASDGTQVGTVDQVVDNYREHILDGIVIRTESLGPALRRRAGGRADRRAWGDPDDRPGPGRRPAAAGERPRHVQGERAAPDASDGCSGAAGSAISRRTPGVTERRGGRSKSRVLTSGAGGERLADPARARRPGGGAGDGAGRDRRPEDGGHRGVHERGHTRLRPRRDRAARGRRLARGWLPRGHRARLRLRDPAAGRRRAPQPAPRAAADRGADEELRAQRGARARHRGDDEGAARRRTETAPTPAPEAGDETKISLPAGELLAPILSRVVSMFATRADLSVDELSDAVLLSDAISAGGTAGFPDGTARLTVAEDDGSFEVRVGPLGEGGGRPAARRDADPGARRLARDARRRGQGRPGRATARCSRSGSARRP